MPAPTLAVPGRGEQPVDQPFVGVGPGSPRNRATSSGVGGRPRRSKLSRRSRVSRLAVGAGSRPCSSRFRSTKASIGVSIQRRSLVVGVLESRAGSTTIGLPTRSSSRVLLGPPPERSMPARSVQRIAPRKPRPVRFHAPRALGHSPADGGRSSSSHSSSGAIDRSSLIPLVASRGIREQASPSSRIPRLDSIRSWSGGAHGRIESGGDSPHMSVRSQVPERRRMSLGGLTGRRLWAEAGKGRQAALGVRAICIRIAHGAGKGDWLTAPDYPWNLGQRAGGPGALYVRRTRGERVEIRGFPLKSGCQNPGSQHSRCPLFLCLTHA